MTHANAPLTPEGRRRLCERIDAGRPIEQPHSTLGNKPPSSRVPDASFRIEPQPEVLPAPLFEDLNEEPTLFDSL